MSRRRFITGLAGIFASACAPAIITTPGLLMPVKKILLPEDFVRHEWTFAIGDDDLIRRICSDIKAITNDLDLGRAVGGAVGMIKFESFDNP